MAERWRELRHVDGSFVADLSLFETLLFGYIDEIAIFISIILVVFITAYIDYSKERQFLSLYIFSKE